MYILGIIWTKEKLSQFYLLDFEIVRELDTTGKDVKVPSYYVK